MDDSGLDDGPDLVIPGADGLGPDGLDPDDLAGLRVLERTAVRVLLVDESGDVLLLRGQDPVLGGPAYWFTPGGGIDPGEELTVGAAREIWEETGLRVPPEAVRLTGVCRPNRFRVEDIVVSQDEHFAVVRTVRFEPSPGALEEFEVRQSITLDWWTRAQLRAHLAGEPHDGPAERDEPVYPEDLLDLLEHFA